MKFLSTIEAAELLNLSDRTVSKYCKEGRLGTRVGWQYIITDTELALFKKVPRQRGNPNWKKKSKSV